MAIQQEPSKQRNFPRFAAKAILGKKFHENYEYRFVHYRHLNARVAEGWKKLDEAQVGREETFVLIGRKRDVGA